MVFSEPQIHAWYALAGNKVQPLNHEAQDGLGGRSSVSLTDYQKLVHQRYADKTPGSSYDRNGLAGGYGLANAAPARPSGPSTTVLAAAGAAMTLVAAALLRVDVARSRPARRKAVRRRLGRRRPRSRGCRPSGFPDGVNLSGTWMVEGVVGLAVGPVSVDVKSLFSRFMIARSCERRPYWRASRGSGDVLRCMDRQAYPSDLSDEQWALIEPMITAWKQDRVARSATGDPGSCDLREIVNAIFYQNRYGLSVALPAP